MNNSALRKISMARVLLWTARLTGTAVVGLLVLMVSTEWGNGPAGASEWAYLAFFPFGFSVGYLLGWRWPLLAGCVSLACMALSQVVIGRVFDFRAYVIWAILSLPGILYLFAGLRFRAQTEV